MNIFARWCLVAVISSLGVSCSTKLRTTTDAAEYSDPKFKNAQAEIEREPNSPRGYINLAAFFMKESRRTGDFSLNANAEVAVAKALELAPDDIPARKLEASLHLANHRFTKAVDAALAMKAELPRDSFVYGLLADAYVEIGDYTKAVEAAQTMVDLKPGTASYSRVAQIRSLHGDHQGAIEMFLQAARIADPADKETQSWCLVQLGDEYWKGGKFAEAEKIYDEALQNFPGYFFATVSKGRVRASVGDYETAERLLTEVQARGPNAKAMLMLGDIYELRGEDDKAREQYEKFEAFEKELGNAADHNRLALSLADRGRIDEALAIARKEYEIEPSIYSADLLGWCLYKSGDLADAKKYVLEAMRLNTSDPRILFHAGMIARAEGDKSGGNQLLKSALERNPAFDLLRSRDARSALAESN